MQRFRVATTIYYGPDSLALLKDLAGRRVLVVTDAFMATTEVMGQVRQMLGGAEVRVFDRVEPNPSIDLISSGFKAVSYTHLDVYKRQVAVEFTRPILLPATVAAWWRPTDDGWSAAVTTADGAKPYLLARLS